MDIGFRVGTAERTDEAMRYTLDVHLWMGTQNLRWRLGLDTRPGRMLNVDVSRGGPGDVSEVASAPRVGKTPGRVDEPASARQSRSAD